MSYCYWLECENIPFFEQAQRPEQNRTLLPRSLTKYGMWGKGREVTTNGKKYTINVRGRRRVRQGARISRTQLCFALNKLAQILPVTLR